MIYVVVGGLLAAFGVVFGFSCYYQLWKFARQCQQVRIAVAQKGRVKLNAPVLEWLLWSNMLDQDKDSNGRMIVNLNGVSVSIIKKSFNAKTPFHEFANWMLRRAKFDKVQGYQPKGFDSPQVKS